MNNKSQSPPPSSAEKEEGHKKRLLQQEDSIVNKATPNDAAQNGNVESAPTIRSTAKAKKQNSKRMDPDALKLRITIQQCCSNDDLMTAIQAYDVAVAKGSTILAQCFYNLLALCDGLAERDAIHIGTPKTTLLATNTTTPTPDPSITCGDGASINNNGYQAPDTMAAARSTTTDKTIRQNVKVSCVMSIAERRRHASRIKAHMDALQIPATEPVYTSLVKLICKTKELDEAETLLQQAQHVQQCRPKLRMYAPLLTAYCQRGQLNKAVHVWLLLSQQDLQVTEREYASLISCATQRGNRVVMERVLCDLAEDVLVPSRGTCQAVAEWFQSPAAVTTKSVQDNSSNIDSSHQTDDSSAIAVQDLLKQIRIPQQSFPSPNMGPVHAPIGWAISNACSIDTRTGILQSGCLKGQRLLPIEISPELWQEMKNANETIVLQGGLQQHASVPFQGGRKGKKLRTDDMSERPRHWQQFQDFVLAFTKRNNNKIDIVIDGANVGYYRRSFPDAPKHVDYAQIDWIVEHFQKQQKSVLLIMHSRHFSRSLMPREFEPLLQKWLKAGILYRTPPGMNDDWFWMHAALYCGPAPQSGSSDDDADTNHATFVVTNDEMRDHHFQMLAQRSFVRWKDRHAIHFSFGDWVRDDDDASNNINNHMTSGRKNDNTHNDGRRQVILTYPEPYTRRIQRVANDGLVIPLPKRGDANRFLDGSHEAPDDAPEEETYLCIRPKEL